MRRSPMRRTLADRKGRTRPFHRVGSRFRFDRDRLVPYEKLVRRQGWRLLPSHMTIVRHRPGSAGVSSTSFRKQDGVLRTDRHWRRPASARADAPARQARLCPTTRRRRRRTRRDRIGADARSIHVRAGRAPRPATLREVPRPAARSCEHSQSARAGKAAQSPSRRSPATIAECQGDRESGGSAWGAGWRTDFDHATTAECKTG